MDLHNLRNELVIANRILSHEEVVDAYGHISVRHPERPDRFFLARSVAPDLVTPDDIIEYTLDGNPVDAGEKRTPYVERFIHGGIFEARPDVMSVVHAHAEETLPFGIASATPLRAAIHSASGIGARVPVWDIADKFGAETNLLVSNMDHARDLARTLGGDSVALMRGHGFAAGARSLIAAVRLAVYLPRNARVVMRAKQLGGEIKYLSAGEIAARNAGNDYSPQSLRAWEYWAARAGVAHLLPKR